MGEMITLDGGVPAYVAGPDGYQDGSVQLKGGLIVIHEVWGLVEHTRDVADRFADEGYLVLAPNLLADTAITPELAAKLQEQLFDPKQRAEAQPKLRELMAPMRAPGFGEKTAASVQKCFDHLDGIAAVDGRIGITGFCFGGTYSFSLAVGEPRLRAAVPFYGHSEFTVEQLRGIKAPVLAFYGDQDERLMASLPELEAAMAEAEVDFRAVVYPGAGHAFFNDTNKWTFQEEAADDAWSRTLNFLAEKLA